MSLQTISSITTENYLSNRDSNLDFGAGVKTNGTIA